MPPAKKASSQPKSRPASMQRSMKSNKPKFISSTKKFKLSKRAKLIVALTVITGLIATGFGVFTLYQNLAVDAASQSACGSGYKLVKKIKAYPSDINENGSLGIFSILSGSSRIYCVIGYQPKPSVQGVSPGARNESQNRMNIKISTTYGKAVSGKPTTIDQTGKKGNVALTSKPVYIRDTNCAKANIKVSYEFRMVQTIWGAYGMRRTASFTVDTLKDWCN